MLANVIAKLLNLSKWIRKRSYISPRLQFYRPSKKFIILLCDWRGPDRNTETYDKIG